MINSQLPHGFKPFLQHIVVFVYDFAEESPFIVVERERKLVELLLSGWNREFGVGLAAVVHDTGDVDHETTRKD